MSSAYSTLWPLPKETKMVGHQEKEKAFQIVKEAMQGDSLLVLYDTVKPLVLACDAFLCGIHGEESTKHLITVAAVMLLEHGNMNGNLLYSSITVKKFFFHLLVVNGPLKSIFNLLNG